MAFSSLRAAKLRSFLTMLGIIIGVAAVVAINAIGAGVKNSVTQQVSSLGSNVLTVTSGQTSSGGKGGANFASSLGTSTLTQTDLDTIGGLPHVSASSPMSLISGLLNRGSATSSDAIVVATTPSYTSVISQKLANGRFLEDADAHARSIVLGDSIKTELFGSASAVGQTVNFRGQPFSVVGVIAKQDTGASLGQSQDAIAYVPTGTTADLTGAAPSIMRIYVKVDSADRVDTVVTSIKSAVKAAHGGQSDFSVLTQADLLATFTTILNLLTTFIAAIAAISLLVGGIGIMNIMLVNVTERTREIGLRKAIGATSGAVLSQFLIEALVLSLIGGALGILVAMGMAQLAGKLANITPAFTLGTILLAVGVSAGIGILFGIAPAAKAARLRPIQALKST
jgi:putative ABC transport system permease protein